MTKSSIKPRFYTTNRIAWIAVIDSNIIIDIMERCTDDPSDPAGRLDNYVETRLLYVTII